MTAATAVLMATVTTATAETALATTRTATDDKNKKANAN